MSELVMYEHEIEKYLGMLNVSADEKRKTRKALAEMMKMLKEQGQSWPNAGDYEQYRASSKTNDKTTTQNISRIKRFFEWQEKENETMTDNQNNEITNDENTQPETWPEAQAEKPKGKSGRKIMSANGQKKTEKLMLYLTPETITDLRDWCRLKGISAVSYITALIEADLHSKADKINTFRKLSDDA